MTVNQADISRGIEALQIGKLPVCIHASLGSFGYVEGGADAILDAFLEAGCTVVVPSFNYANELPTPPDRRLERNGWDEADDLYTDDETLSPYDPSSNRITAADMGAIPTALINRPNRRRGAHPIDSFSGIGPLSADIIGRQTPRNVYGPVRACGEGGGYVLLMGVRLDRMTLLHTAEQDAGRALFRRWAVGADGELTETLVGGCSEGFHAFEPVIGQLAQETTVGESRWRAFPIQATLSVAAAAIRTNPKITHCGADDCDNCNDAVRGGPVTA